ncbi:hypothetical protein [Haloquadratum walsbyi]|uniref:Uncharacterized protein n=1 Tax=Haloquadratum walsbyi J07HQW2 TaxID=1238425 RepID=U1NBK0_9EURY|nr:hypothetical protein [Haloquadratum walsbyi]ERG94265.1 MAG: hypothetical protein J07HQW2_00699 [Haloquadratum walsbyi J07HQW2]
MDEDSQRAIAVWVLSVTSFSFPIGFLYFQGELTMFIIILCLFPTVILTTIGVIPPPWKPISD